MVNKVVPFDQLEDTVVEWSKTIMMRSPLAIRMIKRAMNAELDGQHGLMELAGDATLLYYLTEEAQEGKHAFLEKRDPIFNNTPNFLDHGFQQYRTKSAMATFCSAQCRTKAF